MKKVIAIMLSLMVLAISTAAVGGPPEKGQKPPIKFGAVLPLTGPFAVWGGPQVPGMEFAIEELNAAGGVLGRRLKLMVRDSKAQPDAAITAYEELVKVHNVVAVGGPVSSSVGLALSPLSDEMEVPLFLHMAGSHRILTSGSRYCFRNCLPAAPMNIVPIAALIKEKGFTRVGAIIADYAWGHAVRYAIEKEIVPMKGVTVQIEVAPVREVDFSPYLLKMKKLDPQILILTGHPPGFYAATKQSAEMGIAEFVTTSWQTPELVVKTLGVKGAARVIDFTICNWTDPAYRKMAARFFKAKGRLFDTNAFSGYTMVKVIAKAIEHTGSTDPKDIATALHELKFYIPGYAYYPHCWTKWGELNNARPIVFTYAPGNPGEINPGAGWYPKVLLQSPRIPPYVPEK